MTIRELLAEESPTLRRRLASLFSGLPDETPASPLSCAAGEVVVRQDAPCRCVYVLVEGRADASGLHQHIDAAAGGVQIGRGTRLNSSHPLSSRMPSSA